MVAARELFREVTEKQEVDFPTGSLRPIDHPAAEKSPSTKIRPLYPIIDFMHPPPGPPQEPAPFSLSTERWEEYVKLRNARMREIVIFQNDRYKAEQAETFALENDLRGVPFN